MKDSNRRGGNQKDRDRLTVLSLFTSFGLGDLGVRRAGGRHLLMAEMDPIRCACLRRNYPDTAVVEGDIRRTKDSIIEEARRRLAGDELFLLVATPPCQGMSSNGKGRINRAVRDGKRPARDPRNELVLPALNVIERLRPRWVVFENAVGMRSTEIPYHGRRRPILDVIEERLGPEFLGGADLVNFASYGVPQNRRRLFTIYTRDPNGIALLREKNGLLPPPTHASPVTLRQAIGHFEELDGRSAAVSRHDPLHRVKRVCHYDAVRHTPEGASAFDNGCGRCGDPNEFPAGGRGGASRRTHCRRCGLRLPRPMVRRNGGWVLTRGFRSSYKRMAWDKPAPTITCNLMTPSSDYKLHPEQNRTLSPAEAATLQTVDRYSYDWGENPTDRMLCDALGEAVPPLFFEKLTRHLEEISRASTVSQDDPADADREPRAATQRTHPTLRRKSRPASADEGRPVRMKADTEDGPATARRALERTVSPSADPRRADRRDPAGEAVGRSDTASRHGAGEIRRAGGRRGV
jgi:DNA (cytosine-5)-methyltransferase 1